MEDLSKYTVCYTVELLLFNKALSVSVLGMVDPPKHVSIPKLCPLPHAACGLTRNYLDLDIDS